MLQLVAQNIVYSSAGYFNNLKLKAVVDEKKRKQNNMIIHRNMNIHIQPLSNEHTYCCICIYPCKYAQ